MILEIALGIVLAVVILAFWPVILAGGVIVAGFAVVVVVALVGYVLIVDRPDVAGNLAIVAAIVGTPFALLWYCEKRRLPIGVTDIILLPIVLFLTMAIVHTILSELNFGTAQFLKAGWGDALLPIIILVCLAFWYLWYCRNLYRRIRDYRQQKARF